MIMVVEDEDSLRQAASDKLRREGYGVVEAENGFEALEALKKNKIDLILLDIIMPRMDGFAVLKKLREDEDYTDMPVIMLTNLGQEEDQQKGEALGVQGYLIKANLKLEDVVNKVRNTLNT